MGSEYRIRYRFRAQTLWHQFSFTSMDGTISCLNAKLRIGESRQLFNGPDFDLILYDEHEKEIAEHEFIWADVSLNVKRIPAQNTLIGGLKKYRENPETYLEKKHKVVTSQTICTFCGKVGDHVNMMCAHREELKKDKNYAPLRTCKGIPKNKLKRAQGEDACRVNVLLSEDGLVERVAPDHTNVAPSKKSRK